MTSRNKSTVYSISSCLVRKRINSQWGSDLLKDLSASCYIEPQYVSLDFVARCYERACGVGHQPMYVLRADQNQLSALFGEKSGTGDTTSAITSPSA